MSSNTEKTQKALKAEFLAQEELRIEEARRNFQEKQKEKAVLAKKAQTKKEEDVFRFVKPRKSKVNSVAKPNVKISEAESVAEFIPPVPSLSDVSELDPVVVSSTSIFVDDNTFESHSILTSDDDVEIVEYPDEFQDSNHESDRWVVGEDEEIVIEDSDSEHDPLASDLGEPQDVSDKEDEDVWVEDDPEFSVVDTIVDSVFESEPPVSDEEADYRYALALHLSELHQVSNLSERELTDYAYFLREAYNRGENDDGKNLNVEALSQAAQREAAERQNLCTNHYVFFGNAEDASDKSLHDVPVGSLNIKK